MTNLLLLPARQWAECLVLFCRQKRDVCRHRADSSPVFEGIARSCGRTLGLDFMIKHPEQFVHHYTLSWCSLCSVFFNQYIRLASQEAAKPKVFILDKMFDVSEWSCYTVKWTVTVLAFFIFLDDVSFHLHHAWESLSHYFWVFFFTLIMMRVWQWL